MTQPQRAYEPHTCLPPEEAAQIGEIFVCPDCDTQWRAYADDHDGYFYLGWMRLLTSAQVEAQRKSRPRWWQGWI